MNRGILKKTFLMLALPAIFTPVCLAEVKPMLVVYSAVYDSGGSDAGASVAVDPSENIYVAGQKGGSDFLAIKYSKALVEGPAQVYPNGTANGIAVDSMGNIIFTGAVNNGSNQDYFTVKYSPGFAGQISSASYDSGVVGSNNDVAVAAKADSKDNIFVTGYSFDGATNNFYTIKYDANLVQLSSADYDSGGLDQAAALAVDGDDNVIVAGFSTGVSKDFFIRKYDNNLNTLYSAVYNSAGNGDDRAAAVTVDAQNNVIVTGRTYDGVTSINFFTIKYDGFLNALSSATYDIAGSSDIPTGVAVDSNGHIIVTGYSGVNFAGNNYLTIRYDAGFTVISTAVYDAALNADRAAGIVVDASDDVTVTGTAYNGSDDDFFTVKYNAYPKITEVSPLYIGETSNVTFKGRGFLSDSVFFFDDAGISTGTMSYIPPDQVTLSVTLSSSVILGVTTVTLTNSNGEYIGNAVLPVTRLRKTIAAGVSGSLAAQSRNGEVSVTVPAGAFSQQETFSIYTFQATAGDIRQVSEGVYVSVSPADTPSQNYSIKLPYSASDLDTYPAGSLSLAYYDSVLGWVDVVSSVNSSARTVTGVTKKINAKFAIVKKGESGGIPTPGGLGGATVYPNPYRPGSGGDFDDPSLGTGIVFAGFTANQSFKLLIIDLAGQLVFNKSCAADSSGKYLWDAKTSSGGDAATGVYIYRIEGDGDPRNGKLSIIR